MKEKKQKQNMGQQARLVEMVTVIIFILLILVTGWLWQYKIELSDVREGKRIVIAKINIFELLLSKSRMGIPN
jgi:hypothetical protein